MSAFRAFRIIDIKSKGIVREFLICLENTELGGVERDGKNFDCCKNDVKKPPLNKSKKNRYFPNATENCSRQLMRGPGAGWRLIGLQFLL